MSNFYLIRVDPDPGNPGQFIENAVADEGPFETGPEAAKRAKELSEELRAKVQPRRIRQAPDWKARQQRRLDAGELTPLPRKWDLPPIPDHFAHISARNPSLIAYTASEEHGILDRVTAITPGSYLQRFYPDLHDALDMDDLEEKLGRKPFDADIAAEMRRLGENARKRYSGLIDPTGIVMYARTPDEIENVYENWGQKSQGTLVSCATRAWHTNIHQRGGFRSNTHPVRVYGAGDLAIAYTVSATGTLAERCLVWPARKVHSRFYGDGSDRLKNLLEAEGYTPASNEDFEGAKLLRIVEQDENGIEYFVCPHIDDGHKPGDGALRVRDTGEYLTIDPGGPMVANQTVGWIKAIYHPSCHPVRLAA